MANEKITEYVSSVTALENGDLIDVSKDTAGTGLVWESQKMTQTVLRTTLGVNATARYIPVYDGTKIVPSTIYQSAGGNYGIFGVTTPTFSWSFDGEAIRNIGVERRTGSTNPGLAFGVVSGGAAVGSTDQDAGDLSFATGSATGNGGGRMTWSLPAPNQGAGTTNRSASAKMYLLGAGWLGIGQSPTSEFEVHTASSLDKVRIGSNLVTILSQTTGIGIQMKRPSDGSYTVHGGMFASATSDMLTLTGFGSGFRFVRNTSTDTVAGVTIGSTYNASIISGISSSSLRYDFQRVYNDSEAYIMYNIGQTGTNTNVVGIPTSLNIYNSITNAVTENAGIRINVTGSTASSSTRNYAILIDNGHICNLSATGGLHIGSVPSTSARATIIAAAAHTNTINVFNNATTASNFNIIVSSSQHVAAVTKNAIYAEADGSTVSNGNRALYAHRGNIVSPTEASGGNTKIGIGTLTPNAAARLEISSTTGGFLTARMTATQASAITPVDGLSLYVTDTNGTFTSVGFWGYEAGAWIKL